MATTNRSSDRTADAAKVKVVDSKKALNALAKIRHRDAELLKRLAR